MTKTARILQVILSEREQRMLFEPLIGITQIEAFEILNCAGVDEIPWDKELNDFYLKWQYYNSK